MLLVCSVHKSVMLSRSSFGICKILDPGLGRCCWRKALLVFHQLGEVRPDLASSTPSPVSTVRNPGLGGGGKLDYTEYRFRRGCLKHKS